MSDEFSPDANAVHVAAAAAPEAVESAEVPERGVTPAVTAPAAVVPLRPYRERASSVESALVRAGASDTLVVDASVARALTEQARAALASVPVVVDSDVLLSLAAEDLKSVKALQHEVEARRTAITAPLNEALRRVNELFRAPKQYLADAEAALKTAMLAYTDEQERIAAAAREQAEEDGERQRAALAQRASDHERQAQAAEAAAQASAEAAAQAQQAGDWEAAARAQETLREHLTHAQQCRSDSERAQAMSCVVTVPPCSAPEPRRLGGITGRLTYAARVTDLTALIQAVASGSAPQACVQVNEKFLAAQARAVRRVGTLYPGVEITQQRSLAAARTR